MSTQGENPFAERPSTKVPTAGHDEKPRRLQYLAAYQYVFDHPRWYLILLIGTVARFVPIVGPIVLMGYLFGVVEALHRRPRESYPDFDFNLLGNYLKRGVWPFLVALILMVVAAPIAGILFYVPMIGMFALVSAADQDSSDELVPLVMLLGCGLGMFVFFILVTLISLPSILRAGLQQEFGPAFDFSYIKSFLKLMWRDIILQSLFMMVTSVALMIVGGAMCCVGVYPALVLWVMAAYHFYYQLYELYLARGGMPIPLKPEPAETLPVRA